MSTLSRTSRLAVSAKNPEFYDPFQVESLEQRQLLSVSVVPHGQALVITGDAKPNQISLSVDSTGVQLLCDGVSKKFTFTQTATGKVSMQDFSITGGGGDDIITVRASADYFLKFRLYVDGGAGDDTIVSRMSVSPPSLEGIKVESLLYGGAGDDTIDSEVSSSGRFYEKIRNFVDGGAGDDAITCRTATGEGTQGITRGIVWDVTTVVQGGAGRDSMDVACDSSLTTLPTLTCTATVDGGAGDDLEVCSFSWGCSNSGSALSGQKFSGFVRGGTGDDTLDVHLDCSSLSPSSTGALMLGESCALSVDGGAGDDSVSTSFVLPPPSSFSQSMKDFIKVQLLVSGGTGDDSISCTVDNAVSFPFSKIRYIVDGGSGSDSAVVSGSVVQCTGVEDIFDLDVDLDSWLQ